MVINSICSLMKLSAPSYLLRKWRWSPLWVSGHDDPLTETDRTRIRRLAKHEQADWAEPQHHHVSEKPRSNSTIPSWLCKRKCHQRKDAVEIHLSFLLLKLPDDSIIFLNKPRVADSLETSCKQADLKAMCFPNAKELNVMYSCSSLPSWNLLAKCLGHNTSLWDHPNRACCILLFLLMLANSGSYNLPGRNYYP